MADILDAIYARLQAVSAVTDLVSSRIYAVHKQDATPAFPYVIADITHTERSRAMTADSGYVTSSVRLHIWTRDGSGSSGFRVAANIADAIRTALKRWGGSAAGVTVDHIFEDGEFTIEDPEPGVFHRILDYDVRWLE